MTDSRLPVIATLILFALAGCGQTGPLFLPGDDEPEPTLDPEQEQELDEETQGPPPEDE